MAIMKIYLRMSRERLRSTKIQTLNPPVVEVVVVEVEGQAMIGVGVPY